MLLPTLLAWPGLAVASAAIYTAARGASCTAGPNSVLNRLPFSYYQGKCLFGLSDHVATLEILHRAS